MDFTSADLHALAALLRRVATQEIMPRFRRLPPGAVRQKTGPLDLVTDADEAAEAAIRQSLERDFPGVLIVGEEGVAADPTLLDRLAGAPAAIVLDPIDGTSNYAAGLPLFGVMAAVVEHGRTSAAVILDPVMDSYAAALRQHGAHEYAADGSVATLRVAPRVPLGAMTGAVSWRYMAPPLRNRVLAALPKLAQLWDHRCAAHEYRTLVAGHADCIMFSRLMPWDHLAGVLLVQEAGGYAARFDATPYLPFHTEGGLICAADEHAWRAVRDGIIGAPDAGLE